jgi:hypothetical protein
MFPMRGFRLDFPFVTPPVTRQVEYAVMFPEYVVAPAWRRGIASIARPPSRRHIAVTLP